MLALWPLMVATRGHWVSHSPASVKRACTSLRFLKNMLYIMNHKKFIAEYDAEGIWVYQAFCPEIGEQAVKNQSFEGDTFSLRTNELD